MKIIICLIAGLILGIVGTLCWLVWYFRDVMK